MSLSTNTIITITLSYSNGNIYTYEINENLICQQFFISKTIQEKAQSILEILDKDKIYEIDLLRDSDIKIKNKISVEGTRKFDFYDFEVEVLPVNGYEVYLLKKDLVLDLMIVHFYIEISELAQFKNSNPNLFLEDGNKFYLASGMGKDGLIYEEDIPIKLEIKEVSDFSDVVKDYIKKLRI